VVEQKEKDRAIYKKDCLAMVDRTMAYLSSLGIANSEKDIEALALRNASLKYEGDVSIEIERLQKKKARLDGHVDSMTRQRSALQNIIDRIYESEVKIGELEA
jgi:hypothetical protein